MAFKELFQSISSKEWRFIAVIILVVVIVTGLPYLYGHLMAPKGHTYNGLHALVIGDAPVYYSYIKQATAGEVFFKDLFTSEGQELGTFNLLWLGVGLFARIFKLSPPLAFHISRLLLAPGLIISLYLFLSFVFHQRKLRKICLVFLLFSSGIGAFVAATLGATMADSAAYYNWPVDLWNVESNIFLTLYQTPHLVVSLTLIILIFLFALLAFENRKFSYSLIAGILTLILFNFHPYHLPTIFGVLGVYASILFIQKRRICWDLVSHLLIIFLLSLPSLLYHLYLIKNSLVIELRALQNITLTSNIIYIILGYGFCLFFALLGLIWYFKSNQNIKAFRNQPLVFVVIWFVVSALLIYFPWQFQSRLLEGWQIPMVILCLLGLVVFRGWLKKFFSAKTYDLLVNNKSLLAILFVFLFCFSTFFNISRDLFYFTVKGDIQRIFYFSDSVSAAYRWFEINNKKNGVILSSEINSIFLPGVSLQTVYLGHYHETVFYKAKKDQLKYFFKANVADKKKQKFLEENNIGYIFYSEQEKIMGDFNPAEKNYLKMVFKNEEVAIYEVIKE